MYDSKISNASSAHGRVMSQMDEELHAIDRQKRAVSDRYDAADGLRANPAEEKLQALEIARLQARARAGGRMVCARKHSSSECSVKSRQRRSRSRRQRNSQTRG